MQQRSSRILEASVTAHESTPRSSLGVYGISVASELSSLDPQTLRLYERRGLLTPARTDGGTRRYSQDDLVVLQRIGELVEAGVNLTGIARILQLEADKAALETDIAELRAEHGTTTASPRDTPEG
ncbi:MerR family transcriptional regulator [Rhodococcus sp. UNC363MFTsu5.1]|uniref:MerR family transcriptional regulator n=1 Tax=Rhodococcus sp. UNC363MFTsu5.1 TaxID=1449069 RepID=UPI0009E00B09|nr:MerR family transcriptional regulator [Rhodococcus sp. UNC363MFTsu5.1]